ncbi:hypothetical protein Fmac_004480 [Flemingia macrophylla]|uniref:VQ domain-containing protein n=1 Tax=Flemingia macrophylla TaxID=520843 RepID=A0ABD1N579_9FABA
MAVPPIQVSRPPSFTFGKTSVPCPPSLRSVGKESKIRVQRNVVLIHANVSNFREMVQRFTSQSSNDISEEITSFNQEMVQSLTNQSSNDISEEITSFNQEVVMQE